MSAGELEELELLVTRKIRFINDALLHDQILEKAESMVEKIDPDDAPFLALALQLNAKLWTGDKKLREGLLRIGFSDVLNTEEVHEWLSAIEES